MPKFKRTVRYSDDIDELHCKVFHRIATLKERLHSSLLPIRLVLVSGTPLMLSVDVLTDVPDTSTDKVTVTVST